MTEFFVNGFRSQIDINKTNLNKIPLNKFNELIVGLSETNYETLMKHLKFLKFNDENEISSIKELIKNMSNSVIGSNDKHNKYIELLLLSMTGNSRIPMVGYPLTNELKIELSNVCKKPYEIHTCFNQMIINRDTFREFYLNSNKETTELYKYFSPILLKHMSGDFSLS